MGKISRKTSSSTHPNFLSLQRTLARAISSSSPQVSMGKQFCSWHSSFEIISAIFQQLPGISSRVSKRSMIMWFWWLIEEKVIGLIFQTYAKFLTEEILAPSHSRLSPSFVLHESNSCCRFFLQLGDTWSDFNVSGMMVTPLRTWGYQLP